MVDIFQLAKEIENIQWAINFYTLEHKLKRSVRDKYFDTQRINSLQEKIDALKKQLPRGYIVK